MIREYLYLTAFKPTGYPVRHKHKVPFNPDISVSPEFAQRVKRVRELDQEFDRFILKGDDYFDLVSEAYASNIHWSIRLEGNPLSENEVRRVTRETLAGSISERSPGPSQEVINHLIKLSFPETIGLPWKHQTLWALNAYLLEGTGSTASTGSYRTRHVSVDDASIGEEQFIPAPPNDILPSMEALLNWTNDKALVYEPIIAATVMFHEFESIHPFEDGNGRTGRCLFHLYLQNRALRNSHLCKLDHKMLENKELYYDLLGYTDQTGSYKELLDFVSIALLESYDEAFETLSHEDLLSTNIDEAARRLLIKARELRVWFSVSEARDWVGGLSDQTVRKRLSDLEAMGALESKGRTVSMRYRWKDPLADFREAVLKNFMTSEMTAMDPNDQRRRL